MGDGDGLGVVGVGEGTTTTGVVTGDGFGLGLFDGEIDGADDGLGESLAVALGDGLSTTRALGWLFLHPAAVRPTRTTTAMAVIVAGWRRDMVLVMPASTRRGCHWFQA